MDAAESAPGGAGDDLESLLDSAVGSSDELTTILDCESPAVGATIDLDAEVDAVLVEAEDAPSLPAFDAQNGAAAVVAEPTRIALPEEDPGAGDAGEREIDDLFVELIDD